MFNNMCEFSLEEYLRPISDFRKLDDLKLLQKARDVGRHIS